MKPKIYIDGKEGTTGLPDYERLGGRDDIELLLIDEDKRKDTEERAQVPERSRHCVSVPAGCGGTRGRFAHREQPTRSCSTHRPRIAPPPDWDYGFAELFQGAPRSHQEL